jgi:LPS-assembly protein
VLSRASSPTASKDVTTDESGNTVTHAKLVGSPTSPVQIDCDDMQFFADTMDVYNEQDRVIAVGHVLFRSGGNQIYAERMQFNTKTRTGTFYEASGSASLGNRVDRSFFGTQEPDAYFWGDTIEKLGPKRYRITHGGFTTCVQPTPRWEMTSGTATLTLEEHAVLTNSIFKVKGVPLMYLPVFYYPIKKDDRATGFLIPTYGTSTVRGQSLSNAFFWAINRSQDATLYYDRFTKTGQGTGGEYRYVLAGGSGNAKTYMLNEHTSNYTRSDGTTVAIPGHSSYQVTGSMTQKLPFHLNSRANADYFTDVVAQQRYQQNVYQATNRTRRFGGNISGNWQSYVLSATLEKADVFSGTDSYATLGSLPRITFNRVERPIAGSKVYFGVTSEYVSLLRSSTTVGNKTSDSGLTRMDVMPVIRFPFTRWPFLSFNSNVSWRGTYWTESLNADHVRVPEGIGRRYFTFQSQITGPVFNRIWNTPNGSYAEKFKHVIEPIFTISRVTAIDNADRIIQLEGTDYVVGSATRYSYGVNNRLYAKKKTAREILDVSITQSYYTDARAAAIDRQYQSSFNGTAPTHFSPVAIVARAEPTDRFQATFRTELDPTKKTLRTLSASGTFNHSSWLQTSAGWSLRRYIPGLAGFDNKDLADHYLNGMANLRGFGNKIGGNYTFNYDLRHTKFLQQRYLAYYNAQCCGVGIEYQSFNFAGGFAGIPILRDNRFNVSFTLAGIGTFSNFFGALSGQQDRR